MLSRFLAIAMVAAGMEHHVPPDQIEELRQAKGAPRRKIRSRFNAYLLGRGKPGDSASAQFFREDRAKRKAREWVRQRKMDGLKPVVERSLPPEREPANQWRRGYDGKLLDDRDPLALARLRWHW